MSSSRTTTVVPRPSKILFAARTSVPWRESPGQRGGPFADEGGGVRHDPTTGCFPSPRWPSMNRMGMPAAMGHEEF
jgi:hypothetical protein